MSLKKSLLLGDQGGHYWLETLRSAMSVLDRELGIAGEDEMKQIVWRDYDLVILDAGAISDLPTVISQIRVYNSEARILVFSSSPDWKQAREVILAGGVDYTRKSLNEEYILSTLKKNLAKPSPPWPFRFRELDNRYPSSTKGREVFVIHGHDGEAKLEVALFIARLGLVPIFLSEMTRDCRTIIEMIEKYGGVDFAIAILTPDDYGYSKKERKKTRDRARQNVIFEMGYFMGRLGREKVSALFKDGVEVLSDFHGVLYIVMDSAGGWKFPLAKTLKAAGFNIDLNDAI